MVRDKVLHNSLDEFNFALVENKKVHFIGVGGVSMSQLATYTTHFAMRVSGSDAVYNDNFDGLIASGVDVYVGSSVERVLDSDIVVYSSAIRDDDIELVTARDNGKILLERCVYLASIAKSMDMTIAVSGTHGKSTTSALIESVMRRANLPATSHIGAEPVEGHYNAGSKYFIVEACEYRRSFLRLAPDISVVLNIDYDHPDEYSDIEDMRGAFDEFMDRSDVVIANSNIGRKGAITYGYNDADYIITDIAKDNGKYTFSIVHGGKATRITSPLYGRHNIENITACYALCYEVGVDKADIIKGIETFKGLRRRYERVGTTQNGAEVITDYAHHPREIASTISTAHEITHGRVIVAFEPHTYSRTMSLIGEFMECFYWADDLVLLPTFSARESEDDGITSLQLADKLIDAGVYPLYYDNYEKAREYLINVASKGDTILVLGAGSIYRLADMLVGK